MSEENFKVKEVDWVKMLVDVHSAESRIEALEKNQDWYYKKIDFFKDEIALLKQEIEKLKNK